MSGRLFYVGPQWDERRNTSQVQPVPLDAVPKAHAALAAFRASDPALAKWIEDGHPHLTEAEHLARFGVPYEPPQRRRKVKP